MKEPTTIIWKGTHGAAIVKWRASTSDTSKIKESHGTPLLYVLGLDPPRYPVPATSRDNMACNRLVWEIGLLGALFTDC